MCGVDFEDLYEMRLYCVNTANSIKKLADDPSLVIVVKSFVQGVEIVAETSSVCQRLHLLPRDVRTSPPTVCSVSGESDPPQDLDRLIFA